MTSATSARRSSHVGRVVVHFAGVFTGLVGVFYLLSRTDFYLREVNPASLALSAGLAATLLNVVGEDAVARDEIVSGSRFSLSIGNACDAAEPIQIYAALVLASPVPVLLRTVGVVAGVLAIFLVNTFRIVSLYFTGVYYARGFDALHSDVWPALLILFNIAIWLLWASWAVRRAS